MANWARVVHGDGSIDFTVKASWTCIYCPPTYMSTHHKTKPNSKNLNGQYLED